MDWGISYDPHEHADLLGAEVMRSSRVSGFGDYRAGVIRLNPKLTQAEERCTLAHEIVHHENRDDILGYCDVGWLDDRLERRVHTIAARRLIIVPELVDAVRWSDQPDEIAEQLVIDTRTLYTWVVDMTAGEYRELIRHAQGRLRRPLGELRHFAVSLLAHGRDVGGLSR